jgi:hypothetical protein
MIHPILFTLLAPLGLLAAAGVYYSDAAQEAAKAQARAGPIPAAVDIVRFRAEENAGPSGEVVVLAQLDGSRMIAGGQTGVVEIAPLYAPRAVSGQEPALGLMVMPRHLTDQQLLAMMVTKGPIGPILKIHGGLLGAQDSKAASGSLPKGRVLMAERALAIEPWADGRDSHLEANTGARDTAVRIAILSLVSLLGGLAGQWLRARRLRAEAEGELY